MQSTTSNSGEISVLHINSNYILTQLHQNMLTSFGNQKIKHMVFSPIYYGRKGVVEPVGNVKVRECFYKWHRYFFDLKQKRIIQEIERTYDVGGFSCIHAYTLFTDGNCARVLSKKYNKPYIVAVRNTDVNDFMVKRPLLRKRALNILKDAERVFFLSTSYKELVFSKYIPKQLKDVIERKVSIIPNGIDDYWISNPGFAKERPGDVLQLIYAGRIDRNKNIPSIQKAMTILRSEGIKSKLIVVGKVEDEKELRLIRRDSHTEVLPPKKKEDLLLYYRTSDIFIMPSFTESFGLVYAEAMSQGLPVIYSKGQGFDGQFQEGVVGYHVIADDPASIALGIKKVVENYSAISGRCVQAAMSFNWHRICPLYEGIYKDISKDMTY